MYEQLIEMIRHFIGMFEIHPKKTSIHLHYGADFPVSIPKKSGCMVTIRSTSSNGTTTSTKSMNSGR